MEIFYLAIWMNNHLLNWKECEYSSHLNSLLFKNEGHFLIFNGSVNRDNRSVVVLGHLVH